MFKYYILLIVASSAVAEDIFTNEFEALVTYRLGSVELRDPHLFTLVAGVLCTDITSTLNSQIASAFSNDDDNDGNLDINILNQYTTDQPHYLGDRDLQLNTHSGECATPLFSQPCMVQRPATSSVGTRASVSDACLEPITGTISNYHPAITTTTASCYATVPQDLTLDLNGISLPLQAFQQAAKANGMTLDDGLQMGFLSETSAANIIIPANIPQIGGQPLISLLPGGTNNCSTNDARDIGPDGVTIGWWFYFNTTHNIVETQ